LDRLKVNRISIGVGSLSNTAKNSALWRIDSSPRKDIANPPQVFTTDDLIKTLTGLCPVTTSQPTNRPTNSPTNAPASAITKLPTMSPNEEICSQNVELIRTTGIIPFKTISPVNIISQDRETVTFEVKNTFSINESVYVYTQFDGLESSTECFSKENVTKTWTSSDTVTAVCMAHLPVALVHMWVSAPSISSSNSAKVPECCASQVKDTYSKVQLTFKVYCENQCLDERF